MADRYWVGGTAAWDATAGTKWALTSGGAGGEAIPTTADNVYFDANSGAVTVTVTASVNCLNLDFTGFVGTFNQSGGNVNCSGNLTLAAGMTYTSTAYNLYMKATTGSPRTITSNGKTIGVNFEINAGPGITFQLADNLALAAGFTRTTGIFSANGKKVSLVGPGTGSIIGDFTGSSAFYDLTIQPVTAANAIHRIANSIEITNALILDSNSVLAHQRRLLCATTRGTPVTITCNGSVSSSYFDFEDIVGAGTASWNLSAATGGSGDCGGNSGITFTTPVTSYMVGGGDRLFNTDAIWATSSGGTGGTGRAPLPQDTAVLDGATGTGIITQNMSRIGSINAAAFTGSLTTTTTTACYGSITLGTGLTLTASTNTYTLAGRGANTLTSAGKSWAKGITIDVPDGSLTLGDDFTTTGAGGLTITRGTFNANDKNVTITIFSANSSNIRSISMGSGAWTITSGTGTVWNIGASNLTFDAGTSTVKLTGVLTATRSFASGGLAYNNFWNATSGAYGITLTGSATFNQFKVDPGRIQNFTAGTTTTATDWQLVGTAGSLITLGSATAATHTLAKSGGGQVSGDYLNISYSTATPGSTFYAANSIDSGNNSGWTFGSPTPPVPANNLFFGSNF